MPRRLVNAALLPPLLIVIGIVGYMAIERWPLFDALYMSVITLTTIGFGEVHPLTTAGRAFTMGLALSGIFTMFFAASEVLRSWASGELQAVLGKRKQERAMDRLESHVIVCGYGRMGRLVCREFTEAQVPYVVIDASDAALAEFALEGGVPLHGDATNDDCLRRAGIARARALVTVVPA
ncbi:MAG: potassium channel protein, partial [Myxococcales bacterium]|nr:potassium channel protein [Myxococcales bacterium]